MREKSELVNVLEILAPGSKFRTGLESILSAKTGALIVVGDSEEIMEIVEGGFHIDCEFSPSALYELAKMDGAIIINEKISKILKSNAHLYPQVSIYSRETGIRHRTAQRVAKQTNSLVIAISERRGVITFYKGELKYILRDIGYILTKANQAVQTLEKYRDILIKSMNNLSVLEFEQIVTVNDVARVLQKGVLVLRIIEELEIYICQLGTEGTMVRMQLEELNWGLEEEVLKVIQDYYQCEEIQDKEKVLESIMVDAKNELLDIINISKALGLGNDIDDLEKRVTPRGYRQLKKLPRIPNHIIDKLVKKFGSLNELMQSRSEALTEVDGIGKVRAKAIKEGLSKLREQDLFDREI